MYTFVGQCNYLTQCHVIDKKGAVLLLIFINKFVLVLCLSFSFSYVEELKLLQKQKNTKTCVRYFLSNFYFSLNDSPSKTTKNVFYFI